MNQTMWMYVRAVTILALLGIMSVEDLVRKKIRGIWLLAAAVAGVGFMIGLREFSDLSYLFRFIPGAVFGLLAWMTREQIGYGDAILILLLGLYLDLVSLVNVCLIAFAAAGVVSLILLVLAKKNKHFELPLIPFFLGSYLMLLCMI